MSLAAGPFLIAATLLAVGGVLKTARPTDTANALRAVGIPGGPLLVRVGGAAEAAVGLVALATGDRIPAVLLAASYAAFAAFVLIALGRGAPLASCGCFGKADTPPTRLHVILNAGAAAAGLAVALNPGAGLVDVLGSQPLDGVPFVLLLGCGVSFAYLALTSLPRLLQLVHATGGPG
jgi:hypothetical protein